MRVTILPPCRFRPLLSVGPLSGPVDCPRVGWCGMLLTAALLLLAPLAPVAQESGSSSVQLGMMWASESGFIGKMRGALPRRNQSYYRELPPLSLPDPASARVVIYSHGTHDSTVPENCNLPGNAVPPSLTALQEAGVYIWYVCSRIIDYPDRATAGKSVYKRAGEIAEAVRQFRALGVPAANLILAGHSAGGWASLMAAKDLPDEIAGVIAYAPAFARKRSDAALYPWWRAEVRPRQVAELRTARHLRALVFAYDNDAFDRPQELAFLTETWPETVQLLHWTCSQADDHMSHIKDCALDRSSAAVRDFVLGAQTVTRQ